MITFKNQIEMYNYIKNFKKITLIIDENNNKTIHLDNEKESFDIYSTNETKGLVITSYTEKQYLYLDNKNLLDVILFEISKLKQCKYIEL